MWSNSSKDLREKLPSNRRINQPDVLHGNLSFPGVFGEKETFIFQLNPPSHLETYSVSIGIYAVDEAGNEAEMSNIEKVTFRQTIPTAEPPVKITEKTESATKEMGPRSTPHLTSRSTIEINNETESDKAIGDLLKIALIAIVVCAVLIVLFFLVCLIFINKKGSREIRTVSPYCESGVELKDA